MTTPENKPKFLTLVATPGGYLTPVRQASESDSECPTIDEAFADLLTPTPIPLFQKD